VTSLTRLTFDSDVLIRKKDIDFLRIFFNIDKLTNFGEIFTIECRPEKEILSVTFESDRDPTEELRFGLSGS